MLWTHRKKFRITFLLERLYRQSLCTTATEMNNWTAFKYNVTAAWSRRGIFRKFTDDFGKPPINIPRHKSKQQTKYASSGPYASLTESRVIKVALPLPGHVTDPAKSRYTWPREPQVNHTAVRASYLDHTQASFKMWKQSLRKEIKLLLCLTHQRLRLTWITHKHSVCTAQ